MAHFSVQMLKKLAASFEMMLAISMKDFLALNNFSLLTQKTLIEKTIRVFLFLKQTKGVLYAKRCEIMVGILDGESL
ncbi:hypothetical protein KZ440_05835 [Glaesserella parasuis]|nr:hypothetical protein [Glaesserella parasuis]MCT8788505.1 hypothetical protein [Glaesserella parasuis]